MNLKELIGGHTDLKAEVEKLRQELGDMKTENANLGEALEEANSTGETVTKLEQEVADLNAQLEQVTEERDKAISERDLAVETLKDPDGEIEKRAAAKAAALLGATGTPPVRNDQSNPAAEEKEASLEKFYAMSPAEQTAYFRKHGDALFSN